MEHGFVGFSPARIVDVYMILYASVLPLWYLHLDESGGSLHAPFELCADVRLASGEAVHDGQV
jgi:hypothetical protein